MIQRIKTIYLLVAFVAMVVCAVFSFDYIGLGIGALVAACLSLYTIFLYKKRTLQAKFSRGLCFLGVALICYQCISYSCDYSQKDFVCSVAATAIASLCWILATRGIIKDEKLVRSLDRIR